MKSLLIVVGRTVQSWLKTGIDDYVGRLAHLSNFEIELLPDIKNTKSMPSEVQKIKEGELILKLLQPTDYVVILDERGKEMSSEELAAWVEKYESQATNKRLVYVIGGPYGFSTDVYNRSNERLSLSKMTFSHQMVRLIFVEQLYRAYTIIKGMPYHHS